ncbi:MAG TPA: hypothetical protein VFK69_07355, partial [Candidatus Eisenbacteria bacterium]|nr:hypothetical protein [Candidatus Eisenbacteria bacterium]
RALWAIEELARGSGVPTLALRLGPVVAPELPLWRRLARCGRLPRGGTKLVNPVTLADAIETLRRAFAIEAAWEGWYEVAGAEAWSLAELAAAARDTASAGPAAWEPPLAELLEHRLAECGPWLERFRLAPHALSHEVRGWRRAA